VKWKNIVYYCTGEGWGRGRFFLVAIFLLFFLLFLAKIRGGGGGGGPPGPSPRSATAAEPVRLKKSLHVTKKKLKK